jgi:serine kinase of HPr protein (carbohydrate metabolism regulator)
MIMHAGLLALHAAGEWRGALVEGPSGAGKSDLALRALAPDLQVVSDDQTLVWTSEGRLFGACPAPIFGLIEARGLGVMILPGARRLAEIRLLVVCEHHSQAIERLPEPERRAVLGVLLPVVRLHALEASAPVKLRWALSHLGAAP